MRRSGDCQVHYSARAQRRISSLALGAGKAYPGTVESRAQAPGDTNITPLPLALDFPSAWPLAKFATTALLHVSLVPAAHPAPVPPRPFVRVRLGPFPRLCYACRQRSPIR